MPQFDLARRLTAEALGTAFLVATVVGSGIMATDRTGDAALALLANALSTGAALVVLVAILAPLSGAHFNPAVSLVVRGLLPAREFGPYVGAQIIGGVAGTLAAHLMFDLPLVDPSETARIGPGQWFAEVVATFGLVTTILAGLRFRAEALPWLVGLYITAAYWFTSSTSFANPAVATARSLTGTFAGIRPLDVPAFVACEFAGALLAAGLAAWLLGGKQAAGRGAPDQRPAIASHE
ncbi:MAG: aquaporin family protein [Rhizobiaceae bacterium]|nr:aquaporin family protein [Rhizobiaceae bacterium]